jgi:hypothetical protein
VRNAELVLVLVFVPDIGLAPVRFKARFWTYGLKVVTGAIARTNRAHEHERETREPKRARAQARHVRFFDRRRI